MRKVALVAFLTGAIVVTAPVSADQGSPEPVLEVVDGVYQSEASAYADRHGVSVAEATRRLGLQDEVGLLSELLEIYEPERFAGLWIDNGPKYRVVVHVTKGPVLDLAAHTADPDLLGAIEVVAVDRSLAELVKSAEEFRGLAPLTPFDIEVNVQANVVDVRVADQAAFDGYLAAHRASLPSSARIVNVTALSVPAANLVGGMIFGTCTTGFGIRENERGTRGIVTAGHCPNDASMKVCCPLTSLPFVDEAFTGSHDEQWHTPAGWIVKNQIKINQAGSLRNILGVRFRSAQTAGSTIFLYGPGAGAKQGLILTNTAAPGNVPNANLTYIRATGGSGVTMAHPGDSGGPVYYGNLAYGIIQSRLPVGGVPGNPDHYDVIYTASDYVQSGLDISILTTCC